MKKYNYLMVASIVLFVFSVVPVVFAQEYGVRGKSIQKEVRDDIRDEAKDKAGTRPGVLKALFPRAAIGRGKLTAINGTTLTVEKDGKSYIVLTGTFSECTTQFKRRFWGDSSLSELTVGDILNVMGKWTDDTKTSVDACFIRDTSIQKRFGVFIGNVLTLTSSGWTMTTLAVSRENQIVTVGSSTTFVNRRQDSIGQSDIAIGHRVRVMGLWNRLNNTITEVTNVKDYSLPPRPSLTLTPTLTPTPAL